MYKFVRGKVVGVAVSSEQDLNPRISLQNSGGNALANNGPFTGRGRIYSVLRCAPGFSWERSQSATHVIM